MTKLIIATILFVAAGGLLFAYTQPTYGQTGALKAQIAQYDESLEKARQLQARRQELIAQRDNFNPDDLKKLELLLPDTAENIGLLLELDSLANRHGMVLTNLDAQAEDTPQQSPAMLTGESAEEQRYATISITFSTRGSYEDFRAFLRDMEQSLRLVDLVTLQLSPDAAGGSNVYSYTMALKTYWLK